MNSVYQYYSAKPITEISTTTLAQDAFNLYHTVITDVTERIKGDLRKLGKSDSEVDSIAKTLSTRWKRALDESHCIDHENLIGINLNDVARNIGQEKKRGKLNDDEVGGGQIVTPGLSSGENSLTMGKGIPSATEVSNPYMACEDFNDHVGSNSGSTSPIKMTALGVKLEPDVIHERPSSQGTDLEDSNLNPGNFQNSIDKPLGSDDDESDDEGEEPTDLVVCAYTKVLKKRGNWNMDLKNGVIHFAGKDYAFKEAKCGHLKW